MNNIFKVALLQLNRTNSEKEALFKGIEYCKKAKSLHADIAVFPEMWNTGYELLFDGTLDDNKDLNEEKITKWKDKAITIDSDYIDTFKKLAKELNMAIALTFMEKHNPLPKNTVIIIDRFGNIILRYSKVHTVDFKMEYYMEPGEKFEVCDLNYNGGTIKIGTMICFDRSFPESARILMLKGAEIILVPNACRMTPIRLDELKVRAYENVVGIVTVNYANYKGHSSAYTPIVTDDTNNDVDNELLVMDDKEQIKVVEFDMNKIRKYREDSTLGNAYRKPHAYNELSSKDINYPFVRDDARR